MDAACPCRAGWSVEHPADRSYWPDVLGYLSLSRCSAAHKYRADSLSRFLHPGRPAGVLSLFLGTEAIPSSAILAACAVVHACRGSSPHGSGSRRSGTQKPTDCLRASHSFSGLRHIPRQCANLYVLSRPRRLRHL
ncbi:hypothetical protein FQZ97_868120 [compost metagenome]